MTNVFVNEFDRKDCCVRVMTLEEAMLHYDDKVLKSLQEDGSAFVSNTVEIYMEGCYHPSIVLTLGK